MSPLRRLSFARAVVCTAGCALAGVFPGCTHHKDSFLVDSNERETRAHLDEEARFQELRQKMRAVGRKIALEVPIACDYAVNDVADSETKSDLLALAGTAGIYCSARCCALDPRSGLADLTVTFGTLATLFDRYAKEPQYKGLAPVAEVLRPVAQQFQDLSKEWLPPETLAQVEHDMQQAVSTEETRIRSSSVAASAMASSAAGLPSLRIQSSFLSFNDNGLFEYGLSEAHQMRLSAQEMATCLSLMPTAFDYHSRRAALWLVQQDAIAGLHAKLDKATAELDSLKKLDSLQSLEKLGNLPWLVTGGLVVGLALQGAFIGRALLLTRQSAS